MFAPRPSIGFQKFIEMWFSLPTPSIFFVSRIFPKNVKLQPSFCPCISAGIGSIGNVTPHGVRKSYHRDGTIDIDSLSTGTEAQVAIIAALTISWIVVRLKIKHVNPVKSEYLDFSNKKSEYLDFSTSDMPGYA